MLGLGLSPGVRPASSLQGESLGQAVDWPAETGSDGGEVNETGEIAGLGLTCVSTRTADSTDKTGN